MKTQANFFLRTYDRLLAGVAVVALVGASLFFAMSQADDEAAARKAVDRVARLKPSDCGVETLETAPYDRILTQAKNPLLVTVPDTKGGSFLASPKRVKCRCGAVLDAGLDKCAKCGTSLVVVNEVDEEQKRVTAWEKRYGVKCDDADADGDGFTNREEYEAKTDPTNAKDHPDYALSLSLVLPLKETTVPFVFTRAVEIPNGWRCEFFDPTKKDSYGRKGLSFTAVIGEDLVIPSEQQRGGAKNVATGYTLKAYDKKEELRQVGTGSTVRKSIDLSTVTLVRKSDGKVVTLPIQPNKKNIRFTPVDVQATLVYARGAVPKTFAVVASDEIDLNGTAYRVVSITKTAKGAEVVVEDLKTKKRHTLAATGDASGS